jgi:hypothetical protein
MIKTRTSQSVGYDCELQVSQVIDEHMQDFRWPGTRRIPKSREDTRYSRLVLEIQIVPTASLSVGRPLKSIIWDAYQKIANAILYCVPLIFRSGRSPSIFALPMAVSIVDR